MWLPFLTPLSRDAQRAAGLADPQPFAMADRVRFGELDMLGHVNNAAPVRWFEDIRVRAFVHLGLTRYQNPRTEPRIVIRRAETDWLAEILQDQSYIATARVTRYRVSSFTIWKEIWVLGGSKPVLSATMNGVIVTLKPDGSGRMPLPEPVIRRMRDEHGAEDGRDPAA